MWKLLQHSSAEAQGSPALYMKRAVQQWSLKSAVVVSTAAFD
jgi:hypothetical protein